MPITSVTYDPPLTGLVVGEPYTGSPVVVGTTAIMNAYLSLSPAVAGNPAYSAAPAGLTINTSTGVVTGTPTGPAGSGLTQVRIKDTDYAQTYHDVPYAVAAPALGTPTGLAATATHDTLSVSWDPVAGATGYTLTYGEQGGSGVTSTATAATALTLTGLEPGSVYELTVSATDGETVTDPSPVVTVTTEAAPEPEPDPGAMPATLAALVDDLAPVLAGYLGRPSDPATEEQARAHLPVIVEFVRGYTRGTGWTDYTPPYPLRSVIVSAGARLVGNPEQVTQYAAADYSERPAVLNGYTLAELGVLRRYRKVQA